jgi:parvulin-like peptidyl-prolyl isomerase
MSNRPRPSRPPERRPLTRRQVASQQRESNLQRRVIFALGGVLLLTFLLVAGGLVWEQFVRPRQTIKQVNGETLTRAEYDRFARDNIIQQMVRSLQFTLLFGAGQSFGSGGTFDEQVLQSNMQLADIGMPRGRQEPPSDAIVEQWVNRQLVEQGAEEDFGIELEQGEIDQEIVAELGSVLQTQEALTDTETLTGTGEVTGTAAATDMDDATEAEGPNDTDDPTETVAATPEASPSPPAEPTPTPEPEEATELVDEIVDELYAEYTNIVGSVPPQAPAAQRTPHVSREELAESLRRNFRGQLLQQRVQETLVPELPEETGEPEFVRARHILLQVPPPAEEEAEADSPTEAEATPEAAEATPEATPEAEPTPTPTPTPEGLEQMYAERREEVQELYQQLVDNPESFEEVAREHSDDAGSAARGGEVGAFDREGNVEGQPGQTLVPEFVNAAWELEENEISEPVRTEFGWHIIQRLPEDPESQLQRLRQEAFQDWLEQQREAATIEPPPSPTPTVEGPTPFATEEPAEPDTNNEEPADTPEQSAGPEATPTP